MGFRGKRGGGRFRGKKRGTISNVSQAQRHHFRQFGECHPSEIRGEVKKYTKVEDSVAAPTAKVEPVLESSSESEEETSYQQLISSIGQTAKDHFESSGEDADSGAQSGDDDIGDEDDVEDDDDDVADDDGSDVHEDGSNVDSNLDEDDVDEDIDHGSELEDASKSDSSSDGEENDRDEQKKTVKLLRTKRKRKLSECVSSSEGEEDKDNPEICLKESDPFSIHFERDLAEDVAEELSDKMKWEKEEIMMPGIGKAFLQRLKPDLLPKSDVSEKNLEKLNVKQRLCAQVQETNRTLCQMDESGGKLSTLQLSMFRVLNTYQDVQFPFRDLVNGEKLRLVYCLHALNHVLKSRSRIIAHNAKLKTKQTSGDEDYRDQGLTRPKVLIVLPFRQSALKVVDILTDLIKDQGKVTVSSRKRFKSEYGAENDEDFRKGLKPEDYEATFTGNNDDHFRIGISVSKKSLKLYSPFYSSDIILASPLGLRTVIGAEGEKDRDYDFLSSIEILILDQADIFLMQNWDHILHTFNHLHLQPKESHGVDFSRVRMWTLNGWSRFYRQTISLSSVFCPEINAVFNKHCYNYAGKIQFIRKPENGAICQIIAQLPQIFHRLECSSYNQLSDTKFNFFIKKLLPHHKDPVMSQTFVFLPSYFDFVRVRNYFKKEDVNFVHLNEYASDKGITRARCDFYHGKAHFMLYTERLHFYRRFKIRGIKHLIFYGLPQYPHFYYELCNMIKDPKRRTDCDNATCTVMYSKYDAQRLAEVVGSNRASLMLNSEKLVHMFVTGEDD
ncbi:digestive organ expansion factor homolog [Gigantopelta aegis]|uniref:digestive organ expansion factor homolog n=1 Tax=Gigantopelta aegis TaxID=1735272 RepID=UPI001B88D243|nr:digestive organ expansion factor homolog [Gigantopelta aegis]